MKDENIFFTIVLCSKQVGTFFWIICFFFFFIIHKQMHGKDFILIFHGFYINDEIKSNRRIDKYNRTIVIRKRIIYFSYSILLNCIVRKITIFF